ncbi:formate-dependent phosphoribosylglycinamide formyltransferase [Actinomycetaceae bacterium TAE3-ERU4]|nr:formate-dependent phosphoribosylglycinamide formyltransferase [Actinomycetaceae bacterium TAE3-ERU4]
MTGLNEGKIPTILLLGGGELGREVTISLIRLGARVHVADRYAQAPAMQVAHGAHVIDMTDSQALEGLVQEIKPDVIVPEVEAIAVDSLVKIEESGTKVIPTAFAVKTTMDRQAIRALANEKLGLPTSAYAFAGTYEQLQAGAEKVGYPCFVKPTMSSSGHGQSMVKTPQELSLAWENAHSGARAKTGQVIVEGMVKFDTEITLLTLRWLNPLTGNIETSFCAPIGHRQQDGDYVESWQPQVLSDVALQRAKEIAAKVTEALGGVGIFGVELFICGDEVIFSELSPRPHDTGMVTMATQRYSQFDLHARAILGLAIEIVREAEGASAVIKAKSEISSPAYRGIASASTVEGCDIRIFNKPFAHSGRRMGVVVARGKDVAQAREKANEAASRVEVINAEGN